MDNPHLVVTCVIGDGEAETGPTATAWHGYKFIDPSESGAVLPVLHLNGFKISERTIFGCMDDKELTALFWCVLRFRSDLPLDVFPVVTATSRSSSTTSNPSIRISQLPWSGPSAR